MPLRFCPTGSGVIDPPCFSTTQLLSYLYLLCFCMLSLNVSFFIFTWKRTCFLFAERCDGSATHRSTVYQGTRDIITWMFTIYLCIICQCPRGWWCICWVFVCTSNRLRVVAFLFSKTVFCLKVATLALFMCHMVCRLHLPAFSCSFVSINVLDLIICKLIPSYLVCNDWVLCL